MREGGGREGIRVRSIFISLAKHNELPYIHYIDAFSTATQWIQSELYIGDDVWWG